MAAVRSALSGARPPFLRSGGVVMPKGIGRGDRSFVGAGSGGTQFLGGSPNFDEGTGRYIGGPDDPFRTPGINDANLARMMSTDEQQFIGGPADPSLIGAVSGGPVQPLMQNIGSPSSLSNQAQLVNNQPPQQSTQQPTQQPTQQFAQQPAQQFGLSGAESALGQSFGGASAALNAGARNAVNTLGGDFSFNPSAVTGSFNASASRVDPNTGQQFFDRASQGVDRFSQAGIQAQQQQAALTGALGPQAQQQAIAAFNESPGQQFLREQGEQSVINQASALGGLGGGNVQKELLRFGTGLAQQDFANQVNRLSQLSNQGLQASGQAGQFLSQAGQQQGNLAAQNAQLGTQVSMANAGNRLNAATNNAQMQQQARMANAQNAMAQAQQQAQFQNQQGINIGNLFQSTGQNIAQLRSQAGRDIASQIGQGTSALSNLANQQGTGLSNLVGSGASNIANLLSGAGQFSAQQQQQLAQLLANSATGQGTQLANIAQGQGVTDANLALQGGQDSQAFIGNLLAAFGSK